MATAGEVKWAAGGWAERPPTRRIVCLVVQHREKDVAIESCC